jgi:hypothetical protein
MYHLCDPCVAIPVRVGFAGPRSISYYRWIEGAIATEVRPRVDRKLRGHSGALPPFGTRQSRKCLSGPLPKTLPFVPESTMGCR